MKYLFLFSIICSNVFGQSTPHSVEDQNEMIEVNNESNELTEMVSIGEIRKKLFSYEDNIMWVKNLESHGIDSKLADNVLVSYKSKTNLLKVSLQMAIENQIPNVAQINREQLYYIGANIGFIFPFGVKLIYIDRTDHKPYYHAEIHATTSDLIHSLSVGAAYHPWGKNFYVGFKLRHVVLYNIRENGIKGFINTHENVMAFGINPNVGWQYKIAKKRKVIGFVELGINKSFSSEFKLPPQVDIQFGVAVGISKKTTTKTIIH